MQIILAARDNQFVAQQAVLIGRDGGRYRTLHAYRLMEIIAASYCPLTGLPTRQLSLLTSIRMGYRFRSEVIQKFPREFDACRSRNGSFAYSKSPARSRT
jgi:hypothetical protein